MEEFNFTDKELKEYFSLQYRGKYYVALKREVALVLRKKGYTQRRVSEIMYKAKNHSTVTHIVDDNKYMVQPFSQHVKENMVEWIQSGLYPKSVVKQYDYVQEVEMKLVSREEIEVVKSRIRLKNISKFCDLVV